VIEMENKISEILGFAVKSVQAEEIQNFNNLEIVEASGQYNKEETISVEKLSDYETYYVMILENGDWCFEGYYKEV
jgi:hypothetical protein